MKIMNKKADLKYFFIAVVLIIVIVVIIMLVTSDTFSKGKQFATGCNPKPGFEYKCDYKCSPGWLEDRSQECEKKAGKGQVCCYRPME